MNIMISSSNTVKCLCGCSYDGIEFFPKEDKYYNRQKELIKALKKMEKA